MRIGVEVAVSCSVESCKQPRYFFSILVGSVAALILSISLADAKSITLGDFHTCALNNSKVLCWGDNSNGQLGTEKVGAPQYSPTPQMVSLSSNDIPTDIVAGGSHTCALLNNGTVKCWGNNQSGQLGNGTTSNSATPIIVSQINNAKQISVGGEHSCALLNDGTIRCWGNNKNGQLGNNSKITSTTPVVVNTLTGIASIALGKAHSCAVSSVGAVLCWGDNNFGQSGGSQSGSPIPVSIATKNNKKAKAVISSGASEFTCALMDDNSFQCWGWNAHSQMGGPPSTYNFYPIVVSSLGLVTDVVLGSGFICGISSTGLVKCQGANWYGYLGNGSFGKSDYATPVMVSGINSAIQIAAGSRHACAFLSDKTLKCWGLNNWGNIGVDPNSPALQSVMLGSTTKMIFSTTPVVVNGVVTVPETNSRAQNTQISQSRFNIYAWYDCIKHRCFDRFPSTTDIGRMYPVNMQRQSGIPAAGSNTTPEPTLTVAEKLAKSYNDQKGTITTLTNKLINVRAEKLTASASLVKDGKAAVESHLNDLLAGKKPITSTVVSPIATKGVYDDIVAKQKETFTNLNTILVGLLTPSADTNPTYFDDKTREILVQLTLANFNALLIMGMNESLTDPKNGNCSAEIIQNQYIYDALKKMTPPATAETPKFDLSVLMGMIQCLPIKKVNHLAQGVATSLDVALKITKTLRPKYANTIQDIIYSNMSPVLFSLHERIRFQGGGAPTTPLLKFFADRLNSIPVNKESTDTGVIMEPNYFMLFNPSTQKAEWIPFCSAGVEKQLPYKTPQGQLPVWSEDGKCIVLSKFVKAAMDPEWNKELNCYYWDTARLGKPCTPPKTAWMDSFKEVTSVIAASLEDLFISTAYALDKCAPAFCTPSGNAGFCQKPDQWSNYYYKCQPDTGGKVLFETCDDSGNTCAAFLKTCSDACASPPPAPLQPVCQVCTPTANEDCNDFGFLLINDKNIAATIKTTGLSFTDESGKVVCPSGSLYSCGIPYTLKKCLMGNPYCNAKGYPSNKEGCLGYDASKQQDRCNACKDLQVCTKAMFKTDPLYDKNFCDKCTNECTLKNPLSGSCGDGTIDKSKGEQCDDGNIKDGDGCDSTCKTEKKWCEACYTMVGKSENCKLYYALDAEYAKNPDCKNPYTETELGCTPIKKGQSCVYTLLYLGKKCDLDTEKCFQECEEKEGPPPYYGELSEEQKKACLESSGPEVPTWLNKFGSKATNAVKGVLKYVNDSTIYGKNIQVLVGADAHYMLYSHFMPVVYKLQEETDLVFSKDEISGAMDYAEEMLNNAHPCVGADLTEVGTAFAVYMGDDRGICWNPKMLQDSMLSSVANTGAHEALHAALDYLLYNHEENAQMSFKLCTYGYDFIDHWLMDMLYNTVPGFKIGATGEAGELKSTFCPYFLKEQ